MIKRILVGLDGSAYSKSATRVALDLAKAHGASVSGMAVVDTREIHSHGIGAGVGAAYYAAHLRKSLTDEWRRRTRGHIAQFGAAARRADVPFAVFHEEGVPFKAIVEDAKYHDLIVVGLRTYFHGPEERGPGDTLMRLSRTGVCPILAVPKSCRPVRRVLAALSGGPSASRAFQSFLQLAPWPGASLVLLHVAEDARRGGFVVNGYQDYATAHGLPVEPLLLQDEDPGKATLREAKDHACDAIVIGANDRSSIGDLFFGSNTTEVLEGAEVPVFLNG